MCAYVSACTCVHAFVMLLMCVLLRSYICAFVSMRACVCCIRDLACMFLRTFSACVLVRLFMRFGVAWATEADVRLHTGVLLSRVCSVSLNRTSPTCHTTCLVWRASYQPNSAAISICILLPDTPLLPPPHPPPTIATSLHSRHLAMR